jgi:hypothetical protein
LITEENVDIYIFESGGFPKPEEYLVLNNKSLPSVPPVTDEEFLLGFR